MQKSFRKVCWFLETVLLKSHLSGSLESARGRLLEARHVPLRSWRNITRLVKKTCQYFHFKTFQYFILYILCLKQTNKQTNIKYCVWLRCCSLVHEALGSTFKCKRCLHLKEMIYFQKCLLGAFILVSNSSQMLQLGQANE